MVGKSTFLTVIMLFPLNFISAMAMDMYIPSIPDLLVLWPDKALWVQGSLGIFILAVGLGQIVVGPLSDALGRLKIIYSGFFLYISASVLTALSPSAEWLVGARFIQGMGACCCMVAANAIVRDIYEDERGAQVMSYISSAVALAPVFAPFIGSYLSWQMTFWVLAGCGVLLCLQMLLGLQETCVRRQVNLLNFKSCLAVYRQLIFHRQFFLHSIISLCSFSILFLFFSFSPYLLIDQLGLAKTEFGYWFGLNALVLMVMSFIGGFGVKYVSIRFWMGLGVLCMLVGGFTMMIWLYCSTSVSLTAIMLPMFMISTGIAWTVSPAVVGAMMPFGHIAGSAAALLGCIRFAGSALLVTLMMTLGPSSAVYFASCICSLALIALFGCIFIIKSRQPVVY